MWTAAVPVGDALAYGGLGGAVVRLSVEPSGGSSGPFLGMRDGDGGIDVRNASGADCARGRAVVPPCLDQAQDRLAV